MNSKPQKNERHWLNNKVTAKKNSRLFSLFQLRSNLKSEAKYKESIWN
jgi:hypothetical protein